MRRLALLPLLLFAFLSSCRVLTDSQLENVQAFATASEAYCEYPGAVVEKSTALHVETRLLQLSGVTDGETLLKRINLERASYLQKVKNIPGFDSSIKLIQLYSSLLVKLTSDQPVYDLDTSNTALGEKLSGLIAKYESSSGGKVPEGTAAKISSALQGLGSRIVKNKQAKVLKKIVPLADALITDRMNNLIAVMGKQFTDLRQQTHPGMDSLIENDRLNFIQEFNANIVETDPTQLDYRSVHFYYDGLVSFELLEKLRQHCVTAAKQLADAHTQLTRSIQSKQKLADMFTQTKDLLSSIQQMKSLAASFHSPKS